VGSHPDHAVWFEIGVEGLHQIVGVRDVLSKSLGSDNPHNVVKATMAGLAKLRDVDEAVRRRRRETVPAAAGAPAEGGRP